MPEAFKFRAQESPVESEEESVGNEIIKDGESDAAAFREYLADPVAYTAKEYAERVAEKPNFIVFDSTRTFRALYTAGVRPEDLIAQARRESARVKDLNAFEEQIKKESLWRLRLARTALSYLARFTGRDVDETFQEAERIVQGLIAETEANFAVRPLLFEINPSHAPEVERYTKAFAEFMKFSEQADMVEREIANRKIARAA